MIFPIAMRFRDEKTRRARARGRFALQFLEAHAPFDTPYTLAQGSHARGQRDARHRHRRNAIANRDFLTPALRHRALPNRSYGRLGPSTSRAGGRRVWSEGVAQQKEANRCAQWWHMLSSRANTGLHARRHAPRGVHRIAKKINPIRPRRHNPYSAVGPVNRPPAAVEAGGGRRGARGAHSDLHSRPPHRHTRRPL